MWRIHPVLARDIGVRGCTCPYHRAVRGVCVFTPKPPRAGPEGCSTWQFSVKLGGTSASYPYMHACRDQVEVTRGVSSLGYPGGVEFDGFSRRGVRKSWGKSSGNFSEICREIRQEFLGRFLEDLSGTLPEIYAVMLRIAGGTGTAVCSRACSRKRPIYSGRFLGENSRETSVELTEELRRISRNNPGKFAGDFSEQFLEKFGEKVRENSGRAGVGMLPGRTSIN